MQLKDLPFTPLKTMTAAEKLHQLIQTLPESQINEVLHFAEFLHQRPLAAPSTQPKVIPPGTLTGLRGIAKRADSVQKTRGSIKTGQPAPTDQAVADMLEDWRTEKYLS